MLLQLAEKGLVETHYSSIGETTEKVHFRLTKTGAEALRTGRIV